MNVDQLRRHIEAKIGSASLELLPFPYMAIPNFFPDDIYRQILDYNLFKVNDGTRWFSGGADAGKKAKVLNATPYELRQQINFHKKNESYVGSPEALEFWEGMKATFLRDSWFPNLIYTKFPAYFTLRFGENVLREDFWDKTRSALFLQRHEANYYIGPHTDLPSRIFTCLFSFPDREGHGEYGTQILRFRRPYTISSGRRHHKFVGFEVVKTAEYNPNAFFLFFKTPYSFHAVKRLVPNVANQRFGMQFQFHEPLKGLLTELVDRVMVKPGVPAPERHEVPELEEVAG